MVEILTCDKTLKVSAETRLAITAELAIAGGTLAGGQAIDLAAMGNILNVDELERMHRMKTGALITASVRMGAMVCADLPPADLDALTRFADHIGLAFRFVTISSTTKAMPS